LNGRSFQRYQATYASILVARRLVVDAQHVVALLLKLVVVRRQIYLLPMRRARAQPTRGRCPCPARRRPSSAALAPFERYAAPPEQAASQPRWMPRTSNSFERLRRSGSLEQKHQTGDAVAEGAIGAALTLPRAPSSCGRRAGPAVSPGGDGRSHPVAVRFEAKIS
jgi:hypothetical protein